MLLQVAMPVPDDAAALAAIRRLTHQEVRSFGIAAADFERAVAALGPPDPVVAERPEGADPAEPAPQTWNIHLHSARDAAADLVRFAFRAGASDLLLDEQEGWLDVAIKRAGRKEILPPIERDSASALLRAFKEIAGLSTHLVAAWQTGAATFPVGDGRRADLRIEITPTVHGESLVARIQDRERQWERMRQLPFREARQRREVELCLRQSQGLIVATGPTGHGKTTTLYACLGQLDRSVLNIRTLEDPVEFPVPWITQIPVGAATGRDFADGLRSLLRQAPHVILLGELRDRAAAHTCLEAVETGHLILATLHTRDAIGVVGRLLDMGITGRQLSAGLLLSIGQRLVRRLCPDCRRPVPPTAEQAGHFGRHGLAVPARLFAPVGCVRCGDRGERGLVPLFELFRPGLHPEIEDAVAAADRDRYNERGLRRRWIEAGGQPLVRAGLRAAAAGEVAYAEVESLEPGFTAPP